MKNNVLIILDNSYKPDPRVKKEIDVILENFDSNVFLVCTKTHEKEDFEKINSSFKIYRILDENKIYKFYKYSLKYSINSILDIIKENNIKVVHAHDHISLLISSILLKNTKFNLIYDAHEYISGWYYYRYEKKIFKKLKGNVVHKLYSYKERVNLKNVNELITVSDSLSNLYITKKKFTNNVTVLKNTCPLTVPTKRNKISIREKLSISKEDILMVHSGGLYYFDDVLYFLFNSLKSLNQNIKLLFLCSKKDQIKIKSLKINADILKRIYLHDLVPYSELQSVLIEADIGLIMNYKPDWPSHWFSLPNRIFDYMHAHLAILSTKQPEFEKIIFKYNIGKTYEIMNEEDFGKKVSELIQNLRSIKKNCGLAKNENNWNIEKYNLINVYNKYFIK